MPHMQVEMLTSLLDTLHVDSVDVVANDSGGLIAQFLVARHPERVRTLMLANYDTENDCPPRSFAPLTIALGQKALAGTESALKQFTRPVRIVWGAAGTVFSPSSPDWLAHTFPGSRGVRRVAAGQLFFPEEQPDLIADEARLLWNVRT